MIFANIQGAFEEHDGVPHPDWAVIYRHIQACADGGSSEDLWNAIAREWLAHLREHLPGDYALYETENLLLLSPWGDRRARVLLNVGERALATMTEHLPGLMRKRSRGKIVCLAFRDQRTYYRYISRFYPEGEHGGSGGLYISAGYGHFALNQGSQDANEFGLVHELTHSLLRGTPLPCWVEEALSQLMEEAILGPQGFICDKEMVARHQRHWRAHGLHAFWRGDSFHEIGDWQELSYGLAQIIVRNMLANGREKFLLFLRAAVARDCGEGASRQVYRIGLGRWAAQFLGEGQWDPPLPLRFPGDSP